MSPKPAPPDLAASPIFQHSSTTGHIRVLKLLPDGRRQVTGFLYPGDFLGMAYGSEYAYTAEAIDNAVLCRFPREKLEALFLARFSKNTLPNACHDRTIQINSTIATWGSMSAMASPLSLRPVT